MIMKLDEIFENNPLTLTGKDEVSVRELRKQKNCPVIKCLENLKDTKKVFYKQEGGQWAFSLRKG